jgi:hypothetical protein
MSHDSSQAASVFEQGAATMEKIYKEGAQAFAAGIADLAKAFSPADKSVRCIDEGTPGGLRIAGSGILLGVDKAAELLKASGADGVYSHDECGAAGIYARQNNLDVSKSDEYGKDFAKAVAEKAGLPYKGHIGIGEMKRPSGLHVARVVYYDGTGKFDCEACPAFPTGFVVSRRFLPKDYALEEVKVCIGIATGDHGFGGLITPEKPFMLIAVGDPANPDFSQEKLVAELQGIASAYAGKVKADAFTA